MSLINCERNLIFTWSEKPVLTDIITHASTAAQRNNPARPAINAQKNATFKIADTRLYGPVVTLSTENYNTFLEQLKSGLKRTIKWNKCRSEMTNQTRTNNLNFLIYPAFNKVNRLFVLSFENEEDKTSFPNTIKFEVKDFSVSVDGKSFFDMPVKTKKKHTKKILRLIKTMITHLVIYWTMNIFQNIIN